MTVLRELALPFRSRKNMADAMVAGWWPWWAEVGEERVQVVEVGIVSELNEESMIVMYWKYPMVIEL